MSIPAPFLATPKKMISIYKSVYGNWETNTIEESWAATKEIFDSCQQTLINMSQLEKDLLKHGRYKHPIILDNDNNMKTVANGTHRLWVAYRTQPDIPIEFSYQCDRDWESVTLTCITLEHDLTERQINTLRSFPVNNGWVETDQFGGWSLDGYSWSFLAHYSNDIGDSSNSWIQETKEFIGNLLEAKVTETAM